jgi:hypothetical protein
MSASVASPLLTLPNDLLWSIGHMLDLSDLLRLRRTQRRLGQTTSWCVTAACIQNASPELIRHINIQRRRLTRVHINVNVPPTSTEVDALVALTRLKHLTVLEIRFQINYCSNFARHSEMYGTLQCALPLLRFPRLVALCVRGKGWTDKIEPLLMALLEHAHKLEQLKLGFVSEYTLATWTRGMTRTLANLRCLEVTDAFLNKVQEASTEGANVQLQLPHLEYACLGLIHTQFGCAQLEDIPVSTKPTLVALSFTVTTDACHTLPPSLRWIRAVVWNKTLDIAFMAILLRVPLLCLNTLVIEQSDIDNPNLKLTHSTIHKRAQQFRAAIHEVVAAHCPQLAFLYISWHFETHHLVLLTDLARVLPALRLIRLEVRRYYRTTTTNAADVQAAIDTMRGALPNHIQLIVSHVNDYAIFGQGLEDQLCIDNGWVPTHGWGKLVTKHSAFVESDTHRLALLSR